MQNKSNSSTGTSSDFSSLVNPKDIKSIGNSNDDIPWRKTELLWQDLERANVGSWQFEVATQTFWRSKECDTLHGVKDQGPPVSLQEFLDFVHPEDVKIIQDTIADVLAGIMSSFSVRYRVQWPDRSIHSLVCAGYGELSSEKKLKRISGFVADLTNLKSGSARTLVPNDSVLTEALEQMPSGVMIVDATSKQILFGNDAGRKIFEVSHQLDPQAPVDAHVLKCLFKSTEANLDGDRRSPLDKTLASSETSLKNTLQCKKENGEALSLELTTSPILNQTGETVAGIVLFTDVTEKKRIEDDLIKSKSRLDLVARCTGHVVWEWDLVKKTLWRNSNAEEIFGASSEDPTSALTWWEARIHPDDRKRVTKSIREFIESGSGHWFCEYRFRRKDGIYSFIEDRASIVRDADEKNISVVGAMLDITERKQTEERLQLAISAAESANMAKSQFLANVSHEIRTPLGVIMGFADFILEPDQNFTDAKRFAATIKRNSEQLLQLIDDLLDLSKIEANRVQVEKIRFSLNDFLKDLFSLLNFKAELQGIQLSFKLEKGFPQLIWTDPTKLRQILINIIGNAIKFTKKGSVEVLVRAALPARLSEPFNLCFIVKDTGIGLSTEQKERLFQPFIQADNSMTRKFGGTGLGLVLSKKLAEALGGDVTLLQTELENGSTFVVTIDGGKIQEDSFLPLEPNTTSPESVPEFPETKLKGVRVLLVEDALDNQLLVSRVLGRVGASVTIANNGSAGKDRALNEDFDIILMDIQMPGEIDGYEATKLLRKSGYRKPIIALTAHAGANEREQSFRVGCDEHLSKPINKKALIEAIEHFASKGRADEFEKPVFH